MGIQSQTALILSIKSKLFPSHKYDDVELTLTKIPPAVTVFMSREGFFEVNYGLFITCKKSDQPVFKSLEQKAEKMTKTTKSKKKNKYLESSDEDEELSPEKKVKIDLT